MHLTEEKQAAMRAILEYYEDALIEAGHSFVSEFRMLKTLADLNTAMASSAPEPDIRIYLYDEPVQVLGIKAGPVVTGIHHGVAQLICARDWRGLFDFYCQSVEGLHEGRVVYMDNYGVITTFPESATKLLTGVSR